MSDERQKIMIYSLEHLIYPKYLEEKLLETYEQTSTVMINHLKVLEQKKIEKINKFFNYKLVKDSLKRLKNDKGPSEFIQPINASSDFEQISMKSALYFKQGKEMLETAINMPVFSSPILLYYGFLQCIKGTILLEFNLQ